MRINFLFLFSLLLITSSSEANRFLRFFCCCCSTSAAIKPQPRTDRTKPRIFFPSTDNLSTAAATIPSPTGSDTSGSTRDDVHILKLPEVTAPPLRRSRKSAKDYSGTFSAILVRLLREAQLSTGTKDIQQEELGRILALIPRRNDGKEDALRLPGSTTESFPLGLFDDVPETEFHQNESSYKKTWLKDRQETAELRLKMRQIRRILTNKAWVNKAILSSDNYLKICLWYDAIFQAYGECLKKAASLNMGRIQIPVGKPCEHGENETFPLETPLIPYLAGIACPKCKHLEHFVSFKQRCTTDGCSFDFITPRPELHMLKCQDLHYLTLAIEVCELLCEQVLSFAAML